MLFSNRHAHAARSFAREIENEFGGWEEIEGLAARAAQMGLQAWQQRLADAEPLADRLLLENPGFWRRHKVWKDPELKPFVLCVMLAKAKDGAALLSLLAQFGHALLPGNSYRYTMAEATGFVRHLVQKLPDVDWPFDDVAYPFS